MASLRPTISLNWQAGFGVSATRLEFTARSSTVAVCGFRLDPGSLYFAVQECVKIWGPQTHVAYINPPNEWVPADDQFSRDVAHNYGGSLELFNSAEEAVAWLNDRHRQP